MQLGRRFILGPDVIHGPHWFDRAVTILTIRGTNRENRSDVFAWLRVVMPIGFLRYVSDQFDIHLLRGL